MPGKIGRAYAACMRVLREAYLLPVHAYRKCVSPWMPPACRYTPSCSAYFVEAVRVKGVFVGTLMGIWRIMRCNPWSRGGYDPVK